MTVLACGRLVIEAQHPRAGRVWRDLAIEVVWTSGGLDKLEIYRRLGIGEVWFWKDGRIEIHVLRQERYETPIEARCFRNLDVGLPGLFAKRRLATFLAANRDMPAAAAPLVVRFQTLLERDDQSGARHALEEAVRSAPRAMSLMVTLAQLEEHVGDDDAAIARYRSVLKIQPASVVALNNLAFALAVRHNAAGEALPLARRPLVSHRARQPSSIRLVGSNTCRATNLRLRGYSARPYRSNRL